jgi:replication factor C large subunit
MLLTTKFQPHIFSDIVGNSSAIERAKEWAVVWSKGGRPRPLLLYGSPGVGKTTLAQVIASEMDWEMIETNASDVRKKKDLSEVLGPAATEGTLTGRRRLIVIDEVDGLDTSDRGAVSAITSVLESTQQPILLIANDPYIQKLKVLRSVAEFVEMKKVSAREIFARLKRIVDSEKMDVPLIMLKEIADAADGDVRSAIVDLQANAHLGKQRAEQFDQTESDKKTSGVPSPSEVPSSSSSKLSLRRDRSVDIHRGLGYLFKAENFHRARTALWDVDLDPEMLMLWIAENIPHEYEDPKEVSDAYEMLSKADVFEGRIRNRQYWGLRRYSTELATAGVVAARKKQYKKFTKYKFPNMLRKMSQTVIRRTLFKSIASKVGRKMHLSIKDTIKQMPIIAPFVLQNPGWYGLEDTEIMFLKKVAASATPGSSDF